MNNEKNKRENKKALKVFIPIIIVSAVIGGIVGGMSSVDGAKDIAANIGDFLIEFTYMIAPYGVVITGVAGILTAWYFYKSAEKEFLHSKELCRADDETDDETEEKTLASVDRKISFGMMTVSVATIVSFIFFGTAVAYMDRYLDKNGILLVIALVFFVAGDFLAVKLQQMLIDFEKVLNPEKQGSVYDFKFKEKWEDSCDEMEKLMIYKASYKAYQTANTACIAAFLAMVMLSFFFDYGPLPAIVAGSIWLATTVSYCLEGMKLEKVKINE